MKKFGNVLALTAAVITAFSFTGCEKKEENVTPAPVPAVSEEPAEETETVAVEARFAAGENYSLVAKDGTVYNYYASGNDVVTFDDFNYWENENNFLGAIEGNQIIDDVWRSLGFISREEFEEYNGSAEYGVYAVRNIPGVEYESKTEEDTGMPEWIMAYFYNADEVKNSDEAFDEEVVKNKVPYFYRRADIDYKPFEMGSCTAFCLAADTWNVPAAIRSGCGITEQNDVYDFFNYFAETKNLEEDPIDKEFFRYIYENFYDSENFELIESPEFDEFKKTRKIFKVVGMIDDNQAFGYKMTLNRYGDYGYTLEYGGVEYVITREWVEKLAANIPEIPEYLF